MIGPIKFATIIACNRAGIYVRDPASTTTRFDTGTAKLEAFIPELKDIDRSIVEAIESEVRASVPCGITFSIVAPEAP